MIDEVTVIVDVRFGRRRWRQCRSVFLGDCLTKRERDSAVQITIEELALLFRFEKSRRGDHK